jgi:hypothetical protein
MSVPKTMFQLSGRGYAAANLSHATLVIIDAQKIISAGRGPERHGPCEHQQLLARPVPPAGDRACPPPRNARWDVQPKASR